MLTLDRAKELLKTTTTEEHLFLHAKNVMAAMGGLAKHFGEDEQSWMAIGYLTRESIAKGGASVEIPDFTQGAYKFRPPLDVIDL